MRQRKGENCGSHPIGLEGRNGAGDGVIASPLPHPIGQQVDRLLFVFQIQRQIDLSRRQARMS